MGTTVSPLRLLGRSRRAGQLLVERLSVSDASVQELRPIGDDWERIGFVGEQRPEFRMVPTEFLQTAITMFSDPCPQFRNLRDQLVSGHVL